MLVVKIVATVAFILLFASGINLIFKFYKDLKD